MTSLQVENVQLNTGAKMPLLGLGTWLSEKGKVGEAVQEALKIGYRHIDCAHIYGNEDEIGEALAASFTGDVAKRCDVFVTSKLWSTDFAPGDVEPACRLTLKNLQLNYVDLYLLHWPVRCRHGCPPPGQLADDDIIGYSPELIAETWKEMEKLQAAGLVKAIGVSNFTIQQLTALLETADTVPAVNQVESHPHFQQNALKEFCSSKGIVFEAYSPLGAPSRPPRAKKEGSAVLLEDEVLTSLSEKYGCSPAQVSLAWAYSKKIVTIPKTVTPARLKQNLESVTVKLDDEDIKKIDGIDKDIRLLYGGWAHKKGQTAHDFWGGSGV
ncbi:aldo-keto reductase family 1 member A1-like [Sycon ciliatum]|uniref:aldo-keto reductase family 1 member A1-like n=1 Tax=Sycon ciliatum TaxID=27933 RepID=UPI0020AE9BC8|eukprot:scpid77900/ scgid17886/ Alcohol dehydrogenase [NADP(+)]; 3-DG-reducing enzyme; Aldehyde reductase; Aldo-keto reductase family 1 member A1